MGRKFGQAAEKPVWVLAACLFSPDEGLISGERWAPLVPAQSNWSWAVWQLKLRWLTWFLSYLHFSYESRTPNCYGGFVTSKFLNYVYSHAWFFSLCVESTSCSKIWFNTWFCWMQSNKPTFLKVNSGCLIFICFETLFHFLKFALFIFTNFSGYFSRHGLSFHLWSSATEKRFGLESVS